MLDLKYDLLAGFNTFIAYTVVVLILLGHRVHSVHAWWLARRWSDGL